MKPQNNGLLCVYGCTQAVQNEAKGTFVAYISGHVRIK